jgi:Lrp/AsnC family transcriptional regulator
MTHSRVMGLNRMGGGYRYMLWLWAQQIHEVDELFTLLRPAEAGAHFEKTVRIAIDWSVFNPLYLSPSSHKRESIHLTSKTPVRALDDTDGRILEFLSGNPDTSLQGIARAMAMSASSIQYRIDKLTEQRIIRGKIYVLRTDKIGVQTYRLLLVDRGMSPDQKKLLYKMMALCPNVVAAISCTGNWDFELRFETENSRELDTFCQSLYDTFGPAIDSVKIIQQFETLKRISYPQRLVS